MKMKCIAYSVALIVPLVFGSACGGADDDDTTNNTTNNTPSAPIEVDESITVDTTWEAGTYRINPSNFEVSGATLTIEPCTTIHVDTKIRIETGGNIVAIGEEDCPITFTSAEESPAPGDWESLNITARADNGSVFEHVIFEYGGDSDGAVQVNSGGAFRSTTVRHTTGLGIGMYEGKLFDFTDITFESIPGYPVQLLASEVEAVDGVTSTDVQDERILVFGGEISEPATWAPQSIPYELDGPAGNLSVKEALTVEAGTQLRIAPEGGIRIESEGSLEFSGTEENPVVIESAKQPQAVGDWHQINFVEGAKASSFAWTTIRHGGGNENDPAGPGILKTDDTTINLDNVIFEDNQGCDVSADEGLITATDSTYTEC